MPTVATSLPRGGSIRAVLFDAVGTLIVPDPPVLDAYLAAGRRHGSRLARRQVADGFKRAYARQERLDRVRGNGRTDESGEQRRWRKIVAEVFPDVVGESLFADLWRHFSRPEHWRLVEDAAAGWQALAEGGLVVGVASNFDARLRTILDGLPLAPAAGEHVFISSEIGFRKPRREFFGAIERRLGLAPGELLLVGDDPANDFHGARRCGWEAVLVGRGGTGSLAALAERLAGGRCG